MLNLKEKNGIPRLGYLCKHFENILAFTECQCKQRNNKSVGDNRKYIPM